MPQELAEGSAQPQSRGVRVLGPHTAPPDAPAGFGDPRLRHVVSAMASVVSGLLALLFVACALLPLIHVAGAVPRGFQVTHILAQSTGQPTSDAGIRIVSTLTDLDDACEDAVQPPILAMAAVRAPCPASPRSTPGLGTTTRAPLDRPPRLARIG